MIPVIVIFFISCLATILLVLRRPYLHIRLFRRRIRLDTYFLGAFLGPALILAAGLLTGRDILSGLNDRAGVQPLGILTLFLSMVFMSIFLDITGFFEGCARFALSYARTDGRRLFFAVYGAVALLTTFTSNDIVILTFTPFVYYFARAAGVNPKPYLIAEFFAANTWSMLLYIGNPTNIVIASAFNLTFIDYTRWMLLPTIVAGTANLALLYLLFRREIDRPIRAPEGLRPLDAITDKVGALVGLALLAGCIAALALGPYWEIDLWKISLAFALALFLLLAVRESYARLLRRRLAAAQEAYVQELRNRLAAGHPAPTSPPGRPENISHVGLTLSRMPWTIVPFVLSLFVTVQALHVYAVTAWLGGLLTRLGGGSAMGLALVYGTASALAANVVNNIPMTLAFASMMQHLAGPALRVAALATTVGANLGANLTPLGALAGIMWMSLLRDKEVRISFGEFVKYGLAVTPISLLACLAALALALGT